MKDPRLQKLFSCLVDHLLRIMDPNLRGEDTPPPSASDCNNALKLLKDFGYDPFEDTPDRGAEDTAEIPDMTEAVQDVLSQYGLQIPKQIGGP